MHRVDRLEGVATLLRLLEHQPREFHRQADVADRTIRELTDNIEESVRAFQQIVGGSSQQQIGFEQVTQAFRNIGIASQETANSTKQSEKAAANLNALSLQLRAAVEKYRI